MKQNYTDITILLDRTGSMASIANDTIGGFNKFVEDQKKLPGECTLSLIQFDSQNPHEVVHNAIEISKVPALNSETFQPRASTPLLDAMGKAIFATGNRLSNMTEDNRPSTVIFAVITDGEENSSHEFTKDKIAEMIKHQQENYNWQIVFLGANMDAVNVGTGYGISGRSTMTYAADAHGTQSMYSALSNAVSCTRSTGAPIAFSDVDRDTAVASS